MPSHGPVKRQQDDRYQFVANILIESPTPPCSGAGLMRFKKILARHRNRGQPVLPVGITLFAMVDKVESGFFVVCGWA